VARRLGHGVAVLLNVYANCIDGQGEAANHRIAAALGAAPASGKMVTSEAASADGTSLAAGQARDVDSGRVA
jgi:hypothetical protein